MTKREPKPDSERENVLAASALAALGEECERLIAVEVWASHQALVAVSGGADSVALLRTLMFLKQHHPQGPPLAVVHVDHALRGGESDADAEFVRGLAAQYGVKCFAEAITPQKNVSENGLRQQRYDVFLNVAKRIGARYIFTGHHNDDQVETILFRIFRGTGMTGLRGIPAIRALKNENITLVRPFLNVARATVEMAMKCIDQPFRIDSSNETLHCSRNFLRHALLPEARSWFGTQIDAAIIRLSQHATDAVELERILVDQFFERNFYESNVDGVRFLTAQLAAEHPAVARAVLHRGWSDRGWPLGDMTRQRWQELVALVDSASVDGAILNLPGGVRLSIDNRYTAMSRPWPADPTTAPHP